MMNQIDLITYATAAVILTGWAGIFAYVTLKVWNGWLSLKRAELDLAAQQHGALGSGSGLSAGARIDMADIKERLRKLEAIASGVDL